MLDTLKTHLSFLFYIMIASALYALGNFYESSKNAEKKPLYIIVLISLAFAFVEYIIKIPTYYYHKKIYTPSQMQMVWLMMTSFMVMLYDVYILQNKLNMHTIINFIIVTAVFIFEAMLTSSDKKK